MTDIRERLWELSDTSLAQRLADVVRNKPTRLWELAEQLFDVEDEHERDRRADELDRVVLRNPVAFVFAPGADGIDRAALRPEPGPDVVRARFEAMCHFSRVAPQPEPYARAWLKRRPGWCQSCGDPLAAPDTVGRCQSCEVATGWLQARGRVGVACQAVTPVGCPSERAS